MLLELRQVRKSHGDNPVIRGVDLGVKDGEFVGVIGPSGSGKSTVFGLIAGHLSCDEGSVWLEGRDVTALGARERCRAGIGHMAQIPRMFDAMTVFENAQVAAILGAGLLGRWADLAAREALQRCGLLAVCDWPAHSLGLLQRKRLELARALATGPQVLLLDELGIDLTDAEVHELLDLVRDIHSRGVTVLCIEHRVHALVSVAQRLVVLAGGTVLADGRPHAVINSPCVRETKFGSALNLEGSARCSV